MKTIKKIVNSIFLVLIISVTTFNNVSFANINIKSSSSAYKESVGEKPTLFSDIIDWRYKSEEGKLYRRQYNYSKGDWVGDWELCE